MPYDPDPRKKISRDFFQSCLYAYHEQAHLLTDDESNTLLLVLRAYPRRDRVTRNTFHAAKDLLKGVHNRS